MLTQDLRLAYDTILRMESTAELPRPLLISAVRQQSRGIELEDSKFESGFVGYTGHLSAGVSKFCAVVCCRER